MTSRLLVILCVCSTVFIVCDAQGGEPCRPANGMFEVFKKVSESAEIGDKIYTLDISGTDSDVSLSATYNEYFAFDSTNRVVIVNGTLDAETNSESQEVRITCRELATGRTQSITVYISISDANDNGPVFPYDVFNLTVGEMTEVNSIITVDMVATDADVSPTFNLIYYSILDGPYSDYFLISNPLWPDLTLLKQLDYETLPQFSITIMAQDQPKSGSVQFNATCELVISVTDEDDQYPVFNSSVYRGIIANNSVKGSVVPITPHIHAYDPDLTLNTPVVYSFHGAEVLSNGGQTVLPETDVGPEFTSDEAHQSTKILAIDPNTAVVTLNDFPTADQVLLLVQATQIDNPSRYGVALLAVQVQGSNVNAPVFTKSTYNVVVSEVFPVGEVVTSVFATDKDPGSIVMYSFSAPSDYFSIVADTGDIKLTQALDYFIQPQHVLNVIASDGTMQSSATVTIIVKPVNKRPPTILNSWLNITTTRRKGAIIIDIDAEDVDQGSVLTYKLLNYNEFFSIDQTTGIVKITADPDDLILDVYQLTVIVSDNGSPSFEKAAVVEVHFPTLTPVASASVMEEDSVLPIVFGAIAAVFLIVIIILIVYICRNRLRDKEHLDRVKKQYPSQDPKALAFKKKQGTLGRQAKINIDFQEEASDGDTTVQENPLSTVNKGSYYNYGMINPSDTETEADANDIQVETSVVPYDVHNNDDNNNDNIYNTSQGSVDSEEYSHSLKNALTPFYRNGSLSTYHESSDSDTSLNVSPTASSDSKKALVTESSLADNHLPEENGGPWDRKANSIPTISNMPSLDPDSSVVPASQKQELTVYF